MNSKYFEKNKNKSQDNSYGFISFRKKDINYHKDNNRTIETEKITKPKTILRFNNLINYNNKRDKSNLSYNDFDVEIENHKNFNSRIRNNFNNLTNLNPNNIGNSLSNLENNKNFANINSTSIQNIKKIHLIMPRMKTKGDHKDILFNFRNSKYINSINDFNNSNNKLIDKKYSYSHDENLKKFDNYLNRAKKSPEIESCIISFNF